MRQTGFIIVLGWFCFVQGASAQTGGNVRGKVQGEDGQAIPGAYIELKGQKNISVSNDDGSYELRGLPPGRDTILVSFIGLKPVQKLVDVRADQTIVQDFELAGSGMELQEIIVAAHGGANLKRVAIGKLPVKPMDLPQAIMTISESEMKSQQAQRLSDVVKNVNGVYLGATRAGTQETFFARGYSFSSTNMFKNGSRVNTGAMPEVSSLESVEILKGGAAILYGNVAPGGILNMVTKKPRFDFGGEASLRIGSYGLIKPVLDVYGPVNSKIAYRVNATFEQANSYRDEVSSTRYYFNPSFLFRIGSKTDLIVEGDYLNHDFTPDFGIGSLDNTEIASVPRARFMGARWQYNITRQATTSATVHHRINNSWNLNGVLSWQQFSRDYFSVERIQANKQGDWARPLGRIEMQETYLTGQINLTGKWQTGKIGHLLLAGADADWYDNGSYGFDVQGKVYDTINILNPSKFVQKTTMPPAVRISHTSAEVYRAGVYLQDMISLNEKLKILIGARWSVQESAAPQTRLLAKDSVSPGMAQTTNALSPRAGIVYKIRPMTSLFGSYSNSFFVNTGLDIFGNTLAPSIIDQYELGIKNIFLSGRLTVNLTAYRIINNNLAQTAPFDRNGLPNNDSKLKELTGQTTSNGLELDISANPWPGFSLLAGYSLNDMRYTKTPDTKGSYVQGERLVTTPAHTANSTVFYTVAQGKAKGLKFGASVFYTGARYGGWNNTRGQPQGYSRLIPVDGFVTADVTAGYIFKSFSLLLKLSNITNTFNYYLHENYSVNPIAPRQMVSTISYKF